VAFGSCQNASLKKAEVFVAGIVTVFAGGVARILLWRTPAKPLSRFVV